MKITFLVNHDLASLLALNYLTPCLARHDTTVFFTQKTTTSVSEELTALAKYDLAQIETSGLLGFETFGGERLNDINIDDYPRFANSAPDLAVSIRHMSIFKSAVISTPKLGIINLHSGILPNYQGVMATFWALRNHESFIGTTLHRIEDSSIDTGAIISRSSTKADFTQSYLWNALNVYKAGCDNIVRSIKKLEQGKPLPSRPQTGTPNYFSFPTSTDISECHFPLYNSDDKADVFI